MRAAQPPLACSLGSFSLQPSGGAGACHREQPCWSVGIPCPFTQEFIFRALNAVTTELFVGSLEAKGVQLQPLQLPPRLGRRHLFHSTWPSNTGMASRIYQELIWESQFVMAHRVFLNTGRGQCLHHQWVPCPGPRVGSFSCFKGASCKMVPGL